MLYLFFAGQAIITGTYVPAATMVRYALMVAAIAAVVGIVRDIRLDWVER